VPITGRRAAQDGWNPHQEPFQTEKAAKHGNMTKHGHFAEIASRQCFCKAFSHNQDPERTLANFAAPSPFRRLISAVTVGPTALSLSNRSASGDCTFADNNE
jgi:hypothetical protein